MDEKFKVKKLWHYLKIQDEVLAILVHDSASGKDEYLVAEMKDGEPQIQRMNDLRCISTEKHLRIIRQRDENGKYEIPDARQLARDKRNDY